MPSPTGERLLAIQIGAFSSVNSADRVFRQLRGSGFEATQIFADNLYRVMVIGIPASRLDNAVQRLGTMGFRDIIIRE
jgi:cell division protein FtsN